ncbi:hypothetical protein [Bradyrhizobium acaciae]|uniref:hypothetical protein n=1 Tax=Bradyrhizobium acaciae TaxID=2683706 RepID=UPI001E3B84E3|nr:hypothetical protein [Bradyrhizobium acaciae]MCC8978704.1 hypothetical protein [Bradyrhizobium acaciae]
MNIAAGQWMNSIRLRRRDLGLGALGLGTAGSIGSRTTGTGGRVYQPSKPLLDGSYKIPPVKRVG